MKHPHSIARPLALTAVLAANPMAFDPLLDEEEEPSVEWRLGKSLSYTGSDDPTWEAGSTLGASRDFSLPRGILGLGASVGFVADEVSLDSAWNLRPGVEARWSLGRLSLESDGWASWDHDGLADRGAGATAGWNLRVGSDEQAAWSTDLHGWFTDASGSAIGASLSRRGGRGPWSTGIVITARRLWDAEADLSRRGTGNIALPVATAADQWQGVLRTNLSRRFGAFAAGVDLDLDGRAIEAPSAVATTSVRRGKAGRATSSTLYETSATPSARLGWTSGRWTVALTAGSTSTFAPSGGSAATTIPWASLDLGAKW